MINVVTIDFDLIMSDCISFYNDLISQNDGLDADRFPLVNTFPADLYKYEYLTRFIVAAKAAGTKDIYFIYDHQDVVKCLEKLPKDEEYHLYNIDHHHDVGYDINFNAPLIAPSVGDWVKYCKDRKLIQKYTWISNVNSDPIPEEGEKYIDEKYTLNTFNIYKLAKSVDILILCGSLEWIPPIYHPLFMTWQSILEELDGKKYLVDDI